MPDLPPYDVSPYVRVQEAKQDSDRFLTSVINEREGCAESGNGRQGRGTGVSHDAAALGTVPGKAGEMDVDSPTGGTEPLQEEATVRLGRKSDPDMNGW